MVITDILSLISQASSILIWLIDHVTTLWVYGNLVHKLWCQRMSQRMYNWLDQGTEIRWNQLRHMTSKAPTLNEVEVLETLTNTIMQPEKEPLSMQTLTNTISSRHILMSIGVLICLAFTMTFYQQLLY